MSTPLKFPVKKKDRHEHRRETFLKAQNSIFLMLQNITFSKKYSIDGHSDKEWFLEFIHVPFLPTAILEIHRKSNTKLEIGAFVERELEEFQLVEYIKNRNQLYDETLETYATDSLRMLQSSYDCTSVEATEWQAAKNDGVTILQNDDFHPLDGDVSVDNVNDVEITSNSNANTDVASLNVEENVQIYDGVQCEIAGPCRRPLSRLDRLNNIYPLFPLETVVLVEKNSNVERRRELRLLINQHLILKNANVRQISRHCLYDTDDVEDWYLIPYKVITDEYLLVQFAKHVIYFDLRSNFASHKTIDHVYDVVDRAKLRSRRPEENSPDYLRPIS